MLLSKRLTSQNLSLQVHLLIKCGSWEVEYWTKELHISEKKLRALVAKVGVNVADVKKELQQERNYSYSR